MKFEIEFDKVKFDRLIKKIDQSFRYEAVEFSIVHVCNLVKNEMKKVVRNVARRTGHLARSIIIYIKGKSASVGTNVKYAEYLQYGTGLYGPKHRVIKPKRAKALMIPVYFHGMGAVSGGTSVIFRKSSRGIKPVKFLEKTHKAVQPRLKNTIKKSLNTFLEKKGLK